MKALAKEPEARYQTAGELRADLLRFGRGQPVAALAEPTRVAAAVGGAAVGAALAADPTRGAGRDPQLRPSLRPPTAAATGSRAGGAVPALVAVGRPWWPRCWWPWPSALFFLGRALGWWDSTKTLTVPTDVVGKPAAAATTELRPAGLHQRLHPLRDQLGHARRRRHHRSRRPARG